MRLLWRAHASLQLLLLAQCIFVFLASSQGHDDGSLTDKQYPVASLLEKDSSAHRAQQDASRYLVNVAPSNDAGEQTAGASFPSLPPKSPSLSVASTSGPPESRKKLHAASEATPKLTTKMIATSTTRGMFLDLHEPVTTTQFLQSIVLMSVAMCDTLTCPAGFEHRQPAYKMGCVSQVCTLDADGQSCCVRKVQWWMHMLTFFAVFCLLSLLCGIGGGYIQSYVDKMSSRQRRAKIRLSRSDESEDHSSQDGLLENEQVPKDVQPFAQSAIPTAMAAPAATLFSHGSPTLPASSVV